MKDFFFQKCSCGKRTSRVLLINKEIICKDCFDNNKFTCCECGKSYKKKFITTENKTICSNCKSEYTKCKKCGRYFEGYGDDICEECYVNEAKQCVSCGKDDNSIDLSLSFYIGEDQTYKQLGTGMVCYECFEAMCEEYELDFCDECGAYYSRALGRCPDCYK